MEEKQKRNGSKNAETCTSVVRANRGADKKHGPEERLCRSYVSVLT